MTKIVGTDNVLERVLSKVYTKEELKELENAEVYDLMDLVVEYGGLEVLEEASVVLFNWGY